MNGKWLIEQMEKETKRQQAGMKELRVDFGDDFPCVYDIFQLLEQDVEEYCKKYKRIEDLQPHLQSRFLTIATALGMTLDDLRRVIDE
jgi:hypothetical protein